MSDKNRSTRRGAKRLLVPVMAMGTISAGVLAVTATPAHATAAQTYACAYKTNVSLFGGAYGTQGCGTQTSPYASANSAAPSLTGLTNTSGVDTDGAKADYGPATFFSSPYDPLDNVQNSGRLDVSTSGGTTAIRAIAKAATVGPSPFWTRSPSSAAPYAEPAKSGSAYDGSTGYVRSQCDAASGGTETGNVTIKNGFVDTATDANGNPTRTVAVPNPTPVNHRVNYTLDNLGDSGYIIFNERIVNADGTLTVNGAHMYMQGVNAWGDMIIAQTICGFS